MLWKKLENGIQKEGAMGFVRGSIKIFSLHKAFKPIEKKELEKKTLWVER